MRGGLRYAAVLTVAAVALLASCGDDDGTEPAAAEPEASAGPSESATLPTERPSPVPTSPSAELTPTTPTASEQPEPTPTEDPMPDDGPLATAIADLSRQTGVDFDEIQVVVNEPVTWRDGSLGCPEPGKMYTQALVDGYRIVLRAAGEEVAYHGSTGRPPFRCDHPDPNGATGGPI